MRAARPVLVPVPCTAQHRASERGTEISPDTLQPITYGGKQPAAKSDAQEGQEGRQRLQQIATGAQTGRTTRSDTTSEGPLTAVRVAVLADVALGLRLDFGARQQRHLCMRV